MAVVSFLDQVREEIRQAVERLGYHENVYKYLRNPRRTLEVNIPIIMDDGRLETFLAYRSQHVAVLGPYKGGVRFHPQVTKDEVEALATLMSLKNSVLDLPYGGAKGGVIVDISAFSTTEKERLCRGYVRGLRSMVGPKFDIPAPDVGTDSKAISWMLDEYLKMTSDIDFSAFTGKKTNLGGMEGRADATGLGVAFAVREASQRLSLDLTKARVAIQGFGNVGQGSAKSLTRLGAKIVAVTDAKGGIYNEKGINLWVLLEYVAQTGSVAGFPDADSITNAELFGLDVDVLVPAALENQITVDSAPRIRARIIAEGANGPTTPEAADMLYERGVCIIPDILCNGGGVTVSYFEWVQGQQGGLRWPLNEVESRLDMYMTNSFRFVWNMAQKHKVGMREAAYMHAVNRLAHAMLERGWINRLT